MINLLRFNCARILLGATLIVSSSAVLAQVQKFTLSNGTVQAEITPDIGGRVLSFSLKNNPNFLSLGDLSSLNTRPDVSPTSGHIPFMGHENWVGPQSEWWTHQKLNQERADKKAVWPPDPFLSLAKYQVLEQSEDRVLLKSPESSITGVQLVKAYAFIPDKKNSMKLQVRATNIRKEDVSWDIWFNTRVPSDAQVYVPVANANDVRQQMMNNATIDPLTYSLTDGYFSLDMVAPTAGKSQRKGKLMIQPSQGWIACFYGKQVFIIQFPYQPQSAIHPEQGQVELYNDFTPNNVQAGMLELEVHAPYKKLAPKEYMIAEETWTVLEYKGASTRNAHLAFLRSQASELGLK